MSRLTTKQRRAARRRAHDVALAEVESGKRSSYTYQARLFVTGEKPSTVMVRAAMEPLPESFAFWRAQAEGPQLPPEMVDKILNDLWRKLAREDA